MVFLPLLTEPDPLVSSEGSIDPLGTYAIADSLAMRLAPGIRQRQSHPRFLTAIAVSLYICSSFQDGEVASDGVSEPWQVFEWCLVEGLVRSIPVGDQLKGLPGREKAARALEDGVPISAARYLKTPSVFGFHGVYRVLSRELGIEVAGQLGELGYELLSTWVEEQGLQGFIGTANGPGTTWRTRLYEAVRDGLKAGANSRSGGWSGWQFFGDYLGHYNTGPREAKLVMSALLDSKSGFRKQVLEFLVSPKGRNIWIEKTSERHFHAELALCSDPELSEFLRTFMMYEDFSCLLQDAFEDCLYQMSQAGTKITPVELSSLESVIQAAKRVPLLYAELIEHLSPFGESIRFQQSFQDLSLRVEPLKWVDCLLEHHQTIQMRKPPNGKAPWFERLDDGTYIIRPGYRRDKGGRHDNEYIHGCRTEPLWSFAEDLGLVE